MILPASPLLPLEPDLPDSIRRQLVDDDLAFAAQGLPDSWPELLSRRYDLDLGGLYAGLPIPCAFGKASGQLSMRPAQVEEAAADRLGFIVLKTVIAEDDRGGRSMADWATPEARMLPEPIVGKSGRAGWTITWAGRGWSGSLDDYLAFVHESCQIAARTGLLVVPSVKYHLPGPGESTWNTTEYGYTTSRLLQAFQPSDSRPMPLEKDFSPTLAGSDRADARERILDWLRQVPGLIRLAADHPIPPRIGLKLFNARFDDDFQTEMLDHLANASQTDQPDFLVYANRLFNPDRVFDAKQGVAYGGPDLSDRNLSVLARWRARSPGLGCPLELSATGDISSGRIAVEYGLRGATSFQIHTGFQLPTDTYPCRVGSKVRRALHRLLLDPTEGYIAWLIHASRRLATPPSIVSVAETCRNLPPSDLHALLA